MVSGEYDLFEDYLESDVRALYRHGPWQDWRHLVHWLMTEGLDDPELRPGQVAHMAADFGDLELEGTRYSGDPAYAFQLAQEACRHRGGETWSRRAA